MTYCKIDVNNCSSSLLLSALAHFCSWLVLIFALGSCSFLHSARAHFCSRLVLNFALGTCSFLFSARAHFCSRLVLIFARQPPLVPIFALQPLLVRATYRATVVYGTVKLCLTSGIGYAACICISSCYAIPSIL